MRIEHPVAINYGNDLLIRLELIPSKIFGSKSKVRGYLVLLEIDNVVRDVPRQTQVDHPVHEVEGDEHDGEDYPTVLVDITGSHPEDPGGRVGREGRCLGYGG